MTLNPDTQNLVDAGFTLCDNCGDFTDFGGCACDTPPLTDQDLDPPYEPQIYMSIGGRVVADGNM